MTELPSDLDKALERLHEEVPFSYRVSLTLSMAIRDDILAIRNDLLPDGSESTVSTNDVVRLAFIAAARYHRLFESGRIDGEPIDHKVLGPLTAPFDEEISTSEAFDVPLQRDDG